MIVNDVLKAVLNKRNPIILTERKEHADLLAGIIKDKCDNVFVLSGKDKAILTFPADGKHSFYA